MEEVKKQYNIKNCSSCPLNTTDERMMICGHPVWGVGNYDATIITHANVKTFPKDCPLKKESLTEIITYKII